MKISNQFQLHTNTILDQLEMVYYLFQVITKSDLGENQLSTLTWQCLQDNFLIFKDKYQNLIFKDKYNFLHLTPKSLKMLLLKFFISFITAKLKSNEPVVMMIIYYEYEIVYIIYIYIDDI